jgi:hypothetical protein
MLNKYPIIHKPLTKKEELIIRKKKE